MARVYLGDLFGLLARQVLGEGLGPETWCRRCSRRHARRARCDLTLVAVQAKSGRMVKRWVHA